MKMKYSTGAEKSKYDIRTFSYKPTKANKKGGKRYLAKDIDDQSKVGICTAISMTMNAGKALNKKFSADFQYLIQKKYIGDLPHKRDEREYSSAEIDLGEIKYITKTEAKANAKAYVERNQKGKSSCVPSSMCNALYDTEMETLADEPNYRQRVNFPQEGCFWEDQLKLVVNFGVAKRTVAPEVDGESLANKYEITNEIKADAQNHKQKSYVYIRNYNDFVTTLNSGYPITFSLFSNTKEYANAKPKILGDLTRDKATILHAVCAIPNTAHKDGFWITDSSHFGGKSKREITRDFFEKRVNFIGAYFIDLDYEKPFQWVTPAKYQGYQFKQDLTVGAKGLDVLVLQEVLQVNGLFPNIKPTGYFGGISRQAVKDFQKKFEKDILTIIGLKHPTGYFGKSSRDKINKLLE